MLTALVIVGAATIFPLAMKLFVETAGERRRWLHSLRNAFFDRNHHDSGVHVGRHV